MFWTKKYEKHKSKNSFSIVKYLCICCVASSFERMLSFHVERTTPSSSEPDSFGEFCLRMADDSHWISSESTDQPTTESPHPTTSSTPEPVESAQTPTETGQPTSSTDSIDSLIVTDADYLHPEPAALQQPKCKDPWMNIFQLAPHLSWRVKLWLQVECAKPKAGKHSSDSPTASISKQLPENHSLNLTSFIF